MHRHNLIIIILLAVGTPAIAQFSGFKGNIGGTIGLSVPKGEFADTWGRNTFTFGGQIAFPHRRSPIQAGFAFDYSVMGGNSAIVPVSDAALTATQGRLAVQAKVLSYHPLLRLSPFRGKVQPYLDGMIGLRQFTTLSTVTVDGIDRPVSRERDANDFVFSSGWAAGVMVRFAGIGYVEARVERFHSGRASYVDPSSITVDDAGNVGFNTLKSRTDVVNVLLGIGIRF